MPIYRSKPHKYGADADGNRYVLETDVEIRSDISGVEIEPGEVYDFDGSCGEGLCTLDELKDSLEISKKIADHKIACDCCIDPILPGEEYYELDGVAYHLDCLDDYLYAQYHISDEQAIAKYEYTYDDYLADSGLI